MWAQDGSIDRGAQCSGFPSPHQEHTTLLENSQQENPSTLYHFVDKCHYLIEENASLAEHSTQLGSLFGGPQNCLTLAKTNNMIPQNPSYCGFLTSKVKDALKQNHSYSALN